MEGKHRGEQLLYGDFSELFGLRVQGNIEDVGRLYELMRDLDRSLFSGFVSFILSKVGYYSKTISDISGSRTTDNDFEDWVQDIGLLIMAWAEELNDLRKTIGELADTPLLREHIAWNHYYEDLISQKLMKVIFVSRMPSGFLVARGEGEKWLVAESVDLSCPNYIVIHPATYKHVKETNPERLDELRDDLARENVSLLSVDEFVGKFICETEKKHMFLEEWITIRDTVLERLRKDWPILVFGSKIKQLIQAGERLKLARREYEENRLEHSIRDAGFACEALLRILYYKERGKEPDDHLMFEDLLALVKDTLEKEFGSLAYNDLEFIRDWRNKVSHPQKAEYNLDRRITLQVLNRSETFYELLQFTFKPFQF